MRSVFAVFILTSIGAVTASAEDGNKSAFGYISSGSCIASSLGFTSRLEPINPGVSWRTTFNAVGSADTNGMVIEAGQSVDSASFGAGPRMHPPGAHAYSNTFMAVLTEPNSDGSSSFKIKAAKGAFTAGSHTGLHFTISEFELKGWSASSGVKTYGSSEAPVIQTISLADGTKFQRICTMLVVLTSAVR
jgi:hypothetical protein